MVLVVDDAHVMRIVIKDILVRCCGYEANQIREASGGREALALYQKKKAKLVFCDISMPDMDGIEVVKALIEFDPDAKIIMCTASAARKNVQECIAAGAKDYIIKPPNTNRLIEAIENTLGVKIRETDEDDDADADADAEESEETSSQDE